MKKLSRAAALVVALMLALAACAPAEEPENYQPIAVTLAESYPAGTEVDLTPNVSGGYTLAAITVERDGTELVKDPPGNKYAFPEEGEYTVTYTAVKADKAKTLAVIVAVTENPNACPITSRLAAEAYAYTPLDLTPDVAGGYALREKRGIVVYRGETEISADPAENTYTFPNTGVYRVVYAAVKDGAVKTLEAVVNAVEPPGLQPVVSGWPEQCYVNETVCLAPVVEYGYALKSPGGLVIEKDGAEVAADPEGLSYAFTETGEYALTYTVSKAGESDKTRTATVLVIENASLQPISASLAAEYTVGETVDLTPTLSDGYALTRIVVFKGGSAVAEDPAENVYTFCEAGSYSVAYTAVKNGSVKNRTYDLVVSAPPHVDPIRFEPQNPLYIFTELDLTPELSDGYRLAEEGGVTVKLGGKTLAVDPVENRYAFEEFGEYTVVFKAVKEGAPDAEKSVTLSVTENEALMPITAPDTSNLFYNVPYGLTPTLTHGYSLVSVTVSCQEGDVAATVPESGAYTFMQPGGYTLVYTAQRGPSVKTLTVSVLVKNAVSSALQPVYFIGTPLGLTPAIAEGWTADGMAVTNAAGAVIPVENADCFKFPEGGAYRISYTAKNAAGVRNELEVFVYIDEFVSGTGGYSVNRQTGVRTLTAGGEGWNAAYYYVPYEGDYLFTVTLKLAEEAGNAAQLPKVGVIAAEDASGNGISFLLDPSQTASGTNGEVTSCLMTDGVRGSYAQCLLDSALASAGGLTHEAEYALTAVRSGNTFYFFVNGVLYQAREAVLSGEMRIGYAAFARGGTFANFSVSTDAGAVAELVRAAGILAPNGSYANFTQKSYTDTSVTFDADASVATGRGAAKTQTGISGVRMYGDFDLTADVSGLKEMPKNTTVRRIRINFIREDGSKDAVALSARFDNGVLGVQFLRAEDNGALQPEVIANNLVKNFKNDPAYSVERETYALRIRRRVTNGKTVLSASVNGVELTQTSAEIAYEGTYRLGFAADDWGGTVRDYSVSYNPATVPADQAAAPGDTVRLAPLSLAEGWSCGVTVSDAEGVDVTDRVFNRETQAFLSETPGVFTVNYTCALLVNPEVKRVYAVTVTVQEFSRPEIVLTDVVTEGLTGEEIPVIPSVKYGGQEQYTLEITAECNGAPVALSGAFESGSLALVTLLPGEYTIRIAVGFQGETISDSYTVSVTSLGKLEDTSGQTPNDGVRYTVNGALNKNAANTLAYLDGKVSGANELCFNVGNASLNWMPGNKPQAAGNTEYMPVMAVYAREDGLFDLVALDFSTAKLCGANNIGVAAENGGFITLRLYIGAETPAISADDAGWEIRREPAALGSAGGLTGVMVSVQRYIVYAQDGTGAYRLRAAYNVTFNHAATITDYTFHATSPAVGRVTLGLASANTNVILRNILVKETMQSALPAVIPAGQEMDLTAGGTAAAGWTFTGELRVLGTDGAALEVLDAHRFVFPAPGTYAVEMRATAKLSNTAEVKTAVYTVLVTVTA